MSLVSNLFLLFVLASVLVYYIVPHKWQWLVLLVFSYIYYVAGGPRFVVFILFSTIVTWLAALMIEKMEAQENHKTARNILILGLILNFGMLGAVKYTNFAIENLNALFHMNLRGMAILLPLGISFYTFQSSGYLLDVYWKRCEAEKHPLKYALFVSFFPQILQGPIGRYSRLANQFYAPHKFEGKNIARGFERILWGFFKKMILADWAAVFVDEIFVNPDQYSGLALIGILLYTLQLYADFSGGMDVVIGIASMFGIELDENFKRPFFAVSVTDFWHRWHITLGQWFQTYIYIPLGGNRTGTCKWIRNLLVVWILTGIWHGTEFHFILWGFSLFVIVLTEKLLLKKLTDRYALAGHLYMAVLIPLSWMLFGISDPGSIEVYTRKLFPFFSADDAIIYVNDFWKNLNDFRFIIPAGFLFSTRLPVRFLKKIRGSVPEIFVYLAIFWASVYCIYVGSNDPFLYFRF